MDGNKVIPTPSFSTEIKPKITPLRTSTISIKGKPLFRFDSGAFSIITQTTCPSITSSIDRIFFRYEGTMIEPRKFRLSSPNGNLISCCYRCRSFRENSHLLSCDKLVTHRLVLKWKTRVKFAKIFSHAHILYASVLFHLVRSSVPSAA